MEKLDIAALEAVLGHHFQRPELLHRALTHSSRAREQEATTGGKIGDNEQLEFLGDAILGFVTSEELYRRFPEFEEGHLSKLRAHLVSGRHLVRVAREMDLGRYLSLGRGEEKSGGRGKAALLVNALEAIVAAMYLDTGLEKTRGLILQHILLPELRDLPAGTTVPITDYKSTLQEVVHSTGHSQPSYVLVKEEGPEHRKTFTVEARLHKSGSDHPPEFVARAAGSTKKRAEQDAARQALEYLWSLPAHKSKRTEKSQ
ncbi:MAG TPA: ribonuclease III [Terriglobales bacterium]|nr:ribonuclease III [Terriglobales bacterium]